MYRVPSISIPPVFKVLLLLAALACGNAYAAPVEYEFRAFVGTHDRDGIARLSPELTPDRQLIGTFTFDPARIEDGEIAPVTSFRLRTVEGTEILDSDDLVLNLSQLDARTQDGVESLVLSIFLSDTGDSGVTIEMSWAAPGQGQLPADLRTVNLLALQPYGWKLAISASDWECFPGCDFIDERVDAQIWNMKRAAASAEYEANFTSAPARWTNTGGSWTTQSGYYSNAANVAFTSSVYTGQTLQPFVEVRADLYSGFTGAGNAMGLLVNYKDAANFYEVRFTANGVVTINKVANGVRTMLETGAYTAPPKTFFHVSVLRDGSAIEVRVGDAPALIAEDSSLRDGRAGVFASWNRARFDNFAIDQLSPWGRGFHVDFTEESPLEAQSGNWVVENGVYRLTSSQATAISVVSSRFFGNDFALYARMNLQWSGSGNRGGLVYSFLDPRNYSAVLVSPRTASRAGSVEVIEVVNGVRRVLATSSDTQLRAGEWGEVSVSRVDEVVRVAVTGMSAPYLTFRQGGGAQGYGLIGSWNLVRFDDVVIRAQTNPAQ